MAQDQWAQERLPLQLDHGKGRVGFLSSELDLDLAEQTGLVPGEEETPEFAQLEPGRTPVRARPAGAAAGPSLHSQPPGRPPVV